MSASDFIEMLKRVDYPNAARLDPLSLDWAFDNPATASFMQWVCSVGKKNVLSKQEMDEYEKLQKAGKVLAGSNLSDALSLSSGHRGKDDGDSHVDNDSDDEDDDADDDETQLQSDIEQLEKTISKLSEEKKTLLTEKRLLDVKQLSLKSRQSNIDNLTVNVKRSYDEVLRATSDYSEKIDEALQKLTQSVRNITKLYSTTKEAERGVRFGPSRTDVTDTPFLSQVDLSRFHEAEEKFSQDLTAYTKKRFFEGMADIAGTKETDRYSLLDVSQPDVLVDQDDTNRESFLEDCREFALLQKIFPKSEINRLNALVNAKRGMQAVQEAKSILHLLKTDKFPSSSSTISHLQSRAEEHLRISREETSQYQSSIPNLVKELGSLQGTEILTGDYELKLKRQDYFTQNQDRVIRYLEGQRSRSELLLMFYDLELRFHERAHHLLSAAEKLLQSHLHDWNQRMKCLDDPDLSGAKFERNVVDARDKSCNAIYQMMVQCPSTNLASSEDDRNLYLPLDKVKDRASSLYSSYQSSVNSHRVEDDALKHNMDLLEDCVKEGKATLYAESSTSTELPNLTPTDVKASMVSLQDSLSSLTSKVEKVVKDIKQKKITLKGNPVLVKERELFSLFHTKPERLISTITGLEKNLKISTSGSRGADGGGGSHDGDGGDS